MRILVVEDDKDVAGFVVRGLREAGHVVEHADNGRDGLFMAASETFDAVILDRMLPGGIDGLKILETLRGQKNTVPVLILSALAEVDDRVHGLKAGGDDYLTKPFAFAELLARVEALARRGKGEGPVTKLVVEDLELDLLSRAGEARRAEDRSAAAGVPAAGIPDAPRRPGGDPHDAAGRRVGLSFRSADQRDRRACVAAAPEGRQALPDAADPHRAQRGLHAARRTARERVADERRADTARRRQGWARGPCRWAGRLPAPRAAEGRRCR